MIASQAESMSNNLASNLALCRKEDLGLYQTFSIGAYVLSLWLIFSGLPLSFDHGFVWIIIVLEAFLLVLVGSATCADWGVPTPSGEPTDRNFEL